MAMPSSRQAGRISSSMPREMSEYSICRSQIGCVAAARRIVSAPTPGGPRWGAPPPPPHPAPPPRLHALGDRADGFLDRDRGVQARRPVDVDVVDPEPVERVRERRLD